MEHAPTEIMGSMWARGAWMSGLRAIANIVRDLLATTQDILKAVIWFGHYWPATSHPRETAGGFKNDCTVYFKLQRSRRICRNNML